MEKLDVFEYIETAATTLDSNIVGFTHAAEKLTEFLTARFGDMDVTIGVTSRIKTRDSLKEKILRNNLYREAPADRIVFEMHDIIGVKIECRFFKDEKYIYDKICEVFSHELEGGMFCPPDKKAVRLKLSAPQPERQKNGYSIYRIDGNVTYASEQYNFELQIKSLVNSFWSEIEHKLIYKNNRLNQFDNLMKEMLASTHESLSGIDHQLSLIFDRMSNNTIGNQHEQIKGIISLGLNDMYTAIVKANTGIPVSITEYSQSIVDYLLTASSYTNDMKGDSLAKQLTASVSKALSPDEEILKRINSFGDNSNYGGMLFSLLEWMRNIDYTAIAIGEKIALKPVKLDGMYSEVARAFISEINNDFYLNTFFHIFFSIERGTDDEDFADYIRYYTDRILAGKTQDQIYRTLARLSELPAHKLPLTSTIEMLETLK